jgi:hypothetical protein
MHPETVRMPDNKAAAKKTLAILPPLTIPLQVNQSASLKHNSRYWRRVQGGAHSPGSHAFFLLNRLDKPRGDMLEIFLAWAPISGWVTISSGASEKPDHPSMG